MLYHILDKVFQSPTINMFIEDDNFVKLANNPMYYFNVPPVAVTDYYEDSIDSTIHYPIIAVGDVRLCCLHYKNCDEAAEAWRKRCTRIDYENIYVIANSWNLHGDVGLVKELFECKYPVVFFDYTDNSYGITKDNITIRKLSNKKYSMDKRGIVRPDLTSASANKIQLNFEREFDFIDWINNGNSRRFK